MQCLHCGKRLPLLRKWKDQDFCSQEHREEYHSEQQALALARLVNTPGTVERPAPLLARAAAAAQAVEPSMAGFLPEAPQQQTQIRIRLRIEGPDGWSWTVSVPRREIRRRRASSLEAAPLAGLGGPAWAPARGPAPAPIACAGFSGGWTLRHRVPVRRGKAVVGNGAPAAAARMVRVAAAGHRTAVALFVRVESPRAAWAAVGVPVPAWLTAGLKAEAWTLDLDAARFGAVIPLAGRIAGPSMAPVRGGAWLGRAERSPQGTALPHFGAHRTVSQSGWPVRPRLRPGLAGLLPARLPIAGRPATGLRLALRPSTPRLVGRIVSRPPGTARRLPQRAGPQPWRPAIGARSDRRRTPKASREARPMGFVPPFVRTGFLAQCPRIDRDHPPMAARLARLAGAAMMPVRGRLLTEGWLAPAGAQPRGIAELSNRAGGDLAPKAAQRRFPFSQPVCWIAAPEAAPQAESSPASPPDPPRNPVCRLDVIDYRKLSLPYWTRQNPAARLFAQATGIWQRLPAAPKWAGVMAIVLAAGLAALPGESAGGPSPLQAAWSEARAGILKRAAIALTDDFRAGLTNWQGQSDPVQSWSYDPAGFVRVGELALYRPSLQLADYRVEFFGQIEKKGLGWVVRASDNRNYYALRLAQVGRGPVPNVVVQRWPVIDGKPGQVVERKLNTPLPQDTLYQVTMTISGEHYSLTVQDRIVDSWSDDQFRRGGIGFFTDEGEQARLRWVSVWHQYDALGRLCALLAPYSLQGQKGSLD